MLYFYSNLEENNLPHLNQQNVIYKAIQET